MSCKCARIRLSLLANGEMIEFDEINQKNMQIVSNRIYTNSLCAADGASVSVVARTFMVHRQRKFEAIISQRIRFTHRP